MYYNPLTKEEEFHELVKEIESQSAYKRVPSPEKKYMSVAEMGRLLGLKKTDRYWLVHKNFFKTEVILGKMRVELESFEKWYLTVKEAALLAGINPATVHKWIKKGKIEAVQSSKTVRIPRQAFENWLQSRKKEDQHGINC